MISLPFFNKKPAFDSKFFTVSISSNGIKCLIFYNEAGSNKIIGLGKQPLEQGAVRNGIIVDGDLVERSLQEALLQSLTDVEDDVTNVIFGISGDVCTNLMTTARISRNPSVPVEDSEVFQLSQKIIESSQVEASNEILQNTGNADTDLELVTSSTVYTKANNKLVDRAIGMAAESVELAVYTAFTPSFHIRALQKLAKKLKLSVLAIAPEMYSLVSCLKNSRDAHLDCVIIDVGSDATDIGIVFGGGIVASKSLPVGGKHFTQAISINMGLTLREAENIKMSYSHGKLAKNESTVVQSSVEDVVDLWLEGLKITFAEFTGVKTFSPNVFLTGGGAQIPDIMEVFNKEPWAHSIPFKTPPEFFKTGLADIKAVSDSTGRVVSEEFVLPASLSIVYDEMKGGSK